jgi:hypothetical protein
MREDAWVSAKKRAPTRSEGLLSLGFVSFLFLFLRALEEKALPVLAGAFGV